MKKLEVKSAFIHLRAQGESFASISQKLGISKSTCSEWDYQLGTEIKACKRETLEALYLEYGMMRSARIERLGKTLRSIDKALESVDLTSIAPERLLDMKLKYAEALSKEYKKTSPLDDIMP